MHVLEKQITAICANKLKMCAAILVGAKQQPDPHQTVDVVFLFFWYFLLCDTPRLQH